jgi:uncharacterized protein
MEPAPKAAEAKAEWWADTRVLGLMGFGTTTMIAGLTNLPLPYSQGFANNWVVFGMAMAFGGLAQLIAGTISLRKGNIFAGTAFTAYGAFWIAYTLMLYLFLTPAVGAAAGTSLPFGVAAFAFIWMMFTFTFLMSAPKHGWGITAVFGTLFLSFLLLVVKYWSLGGSPTGTFAPSNSANWAVGGIIIVTGFLAWYVATALLTNETYGRKILPY